MTAIDVFKKGAYSCVIEKEGTVLSALSYIGIKPLITTLDRYPHMLENATVADKVIGKAAAVVLALGKAKHAYGDIMSEAGIAYLEKHGITYEYGEKVEKILNRTGDNSCPLELSIVNEDEPNAALVLLRARIVELMAGAK